MEKASPSLGRDSVYKKTSRIKRLPAYLTVQFVRFFVGKAPDSDEMVPKKILKVQFYPLLHSLPSPPHSLSPSLYPSLSPSLPPPPPPPPPSQDVKYTMKVDMYEFCTPRLQEKLIPMRSKFKEVEETKMVRFASQPLTLQPLTLS